MTRLEEQTDLWHILLFGRCGQELLLLRSPSGFRLPELRIPRSQRIAPNLIAEAKRLWKLDTVCLLPLKISPGDQMIEGRNYHVMELRKPEELARVAPEFMPMSELKKGSFADDRDDRAVRQGMRSDGAVREGCGPFSEFGAFERISAWAAEQLRPLGLDLDREYLQLQATASFALIRFTTNRGAVWFKAVGVPNLREFSITSLLTARLTQYVPELLAAKADWNAWLAAEVSGQGLFESSDPAIWCRAAESLAELQIASMPHTADFLTAGAHDVRPQTLLHLVGPFFSVAEELMQAQTTVTTRKLTKQEIHTVRDRVTEALGKLGEARIPNALNHLDLNPCNVVVSSGGCTFLDWAQASIGNPFFSLEYLRQQFRHRFPECAEADQKFLNSYLQRWNFALGVNAAEALLRLAPLTAILAFAISTLPWTDLNLVTRGESAGFMRSLVRRMYRESDQLRTSCAA